jgi:hypothetical protein
VSPEDRQLWAALLGALTRQERRERLMVPAQLDLAWLRDHFRGRSVDWIKAAAARWAGYRGQRGVAVALTQDQVLAIHDGLVREGPDVLRRVHGSDRIRRATA